MCRLKCFSVNIQETNQPCRNPNNQNGVCIAFRSCNSLVGMLQADPYNQRVREFLRQSQCGFVGSEPYVCCPSNAPSQATNPPVRPPPTPAITQGSASKLPKAPDCGVDAGDRIFGGEETKIDEFPWLAQIQYTKRK